jgi:hypothetical protein
MRNAAVEDDCLIGYSITSFGNRWQQSAALQQVGPIRFKKNLPAPL